MHLPARYLHGVVDPDKITEVTDAEHELYLTRFMVCLMCGATLKSAIAILGWSNFRMMHIPKGKALLDLVNRVSGRC